MTTQVHTGSQKVSRTSRGARGFCQNEDSGRVAAAVDTTHVHGMSTKSVWAYTMYFAAACDKELSSLLSASSFAQGRVSIHFYPMHFLLTIDYDICAG